jgi:amino acid transporter
MVPVAGSAYTYAYATLGELFAWIIGWDLVLEYCVASSAVATGWSGYFQNVLAKLGLVLPETLREVRPTCAARNVGPRRSLRASFGRRFICTAAINARAI